MKENKEFSLNVQKALLIVLILALLAFIMSCMYWPQVIPDPPEPVVQDTVCTTYTPITEPSFIGSYAILDPYSGDLIINVAHLRDTVSQSEVKVKLDSLLSAYLPQFTNKVYVKGLSIAIITKGTSDKAVLLGKLWVRPVNGNKYVLGCISQNLSVMLHAMTVDEAMENIQEFRSMRRIDWYGTDYDSLDYIKQALAVIEADSCKGGRDWLDFRHNPFLMIDSIYILAENAGWDFIGENILGGDEYELFGFDAMMK